MDEAVNKIREKLSNYCVASCEAKCCSIGSIILKNLEEIKVMGVMGDMSKGYFSMDVSKGCPKLSGKMCSVYLNRPVICRDFPLFLRGKTLVVAEWCQGYKAGIITGDLEKLKELGIKVYIQ